jgi:hypothetical protein
MGGVYIFNSCFDVGAARSYPRFLKKKRRGKYPAAGATISDANVRPYRENAAAASVEDGRGVVHGARL